MGIAMWPEAGTTVAELLKSADAAMYQAKADGRFTYRFYAPHLQQQAQDNLWLDTALRHALERDEFCLHYQPKVSARTGQILGFEALVRWVHPRGG